MIPESTGGAYQCPDCGQWVAVLSPHRCPNAPWEKFNALPIGCICPPGSNIECKRLDCPRKAVA